jgi:hypothetical protein
MARKLPPWRPGDLKPAPGDYWRRRADPYGVERRYDRAVRLMRDRGYSLTRATRQAGITRERFHELNEGEGRFDVQPKYARETKGGKAVLRRWVLTTDRQARIHAPAPVFEQWQYPVVSRREAAAGAWKDPPLVGWNERYGSMVGSFWNAVGRVGDPGGIERLKEFVGFTVVDITGRRYTIPSVDTILAWWDARTEQEREDFWRLFESDKRGATLRAA